MPSTYQDDVYHCEDPKSNTNLIRCDPTTYLWDIGDLNPKKKPDDSLLCEEIVKILVKAVAEANVDPGAQQASETQREVELWESIMQTSVVDQMEPCVLYAMSFGALTPYAETMGLYEKRGEDLLEKLTDDAVSESAMPGQLPNFDGNYDPLSSILETEFDPFMIALEWSSPLSEPFSLNEKELDDITSRHVKGALSAELGADKIAQFDLTVEPGLPDYKAQILPLTLSGKVSFNDQLDVLDSASLQKTIFQSAFINSNALDLYLFRLKISKEPTLQTVSNLVAGKETIDLYIERSNPSNGFVSKLLIAILLAVGAAIVAILCFAYFLIFRTRSSGKVIETLEETSNNSGSGSGQTSRMSNNKGMFKREFNDGVPGVRTAPTEEAYEEEESQYDIEYAAASNDGVSEYDMDTLPSHPADAEESDDDQSHEMSVIEGFDDEDLQEETVANNSQTSDDNVSLYSYIPTDTSLVAEQTALERIEKKGVLWSVEQQQKAPVESDAESYAFSTVQSFEKTNRTSILGPSDDDAQSRDSMSLLYGTDEDSILNFMSKPKSTELSLADDQEADQEAPIPVEQQTPPVVESVSTEEQIQDKKKKFEDLWKDENEIDEAASVLNYLDSVQSARREGETEEEPVPAPTTSLKIVDVATPMQTPERPPRPDENADQETGEQVLEALVDTVPGTTPASEDNQMNLPLPATLDANFQDSVSVSSSISGTSSNVSGTSSKQRVLGESARTKTPTNKWTVASPASTMDHSVRSTDSAKLRSLLGQGDVNDAALFGKKLQTDDKSASTSSSVNEMEVSMSSCTSNQLKSLLTTESREVGSDDEEDFLFTKTITEENGQIENDEKKETEDLEEDDDDEEDRTSSYLPQSITPRAQVPSPTFGKGQDDNSTVYSALSEAPSVDETIKSNMGWF